MRRCIVRKFRKLPYNGKILVSTGDCVEPDTVVARVDYIPGRMMKHNAAFELAISPGELENLMICSRGDKVTRGQTLAISGDFFNRRSSTSPWSGVIAAVSRHLGFIYIREPIDLGISEEVEINIAQALGIPPFRVTDFMTTDVGKIVASGQIIAKRTVNGRGQYVTSPLYGKVKSISRSTGTVVIAPLFKSLDVPAYVRGTVTGIVPGSGVEIACSAEVVQGVFGVGGESWGIIRVIDGDLPENVDSDGAIIVCNGTASLAVLNKLRQSGARGLVLGFIDMMVLQRFVGADFNPALTGKEDIPFPIAVTEGFLGTPMQPAVFNVFRKYDGTLASMSGATHIRAGVIRPEVILGAEYVDAETALGQDLAGSGLSAGRIQDGDWVRVVRGPHFGVTGRVAGQPGGAVPVGTGAMTDVLLVEKSDGEVLMVPRANVIPWNPGGEGLCDGLGS